MTEPGGEAPVSVDQILKQVRVALEEHDLGEARAKIRQGLALDAANLDLLDLGGFVAFFLGDYLATEDFCRKALAVKPDHAYACKGLGLGLARQGKVDEGVASLERSIALAPQWMDPYWDLAVTLMDAGRTDQALQVIERAEQVVPGETQRLRGLAQTICTRARK
jgi:tetratricopeptide (TPR) repeat protein